MNRDEMLNRVARRRDPWDMIVIGGGATGVGIAVDAATRGYEVLLVEQHDFGKGTSSRSTKLVHGGVRYLRHGNISLVREALQERDILRRNAPHLVHDLPFVIPSYHWWERPFYDMGLAAYNMLAGKRGIGRSQPLSKEATLKQLPNLRQENLRGGVLYFDGQFDDARLLIHLAMTAVDHGATLINYAPVYDFLQHVSGTVDGVMFRDLETGREYAARAAVVINATGVFCDSVRRLANPSAARLVSPSQGIHLVFERRFLPGKSALMVPRTPDGRVLFAIPWHDHIVVGTTDTPMEEATLEPRPLPEEVDFILSTLRGYLAEPPTRDDVRSVFVGIRPLVRPRKGGKRTAALSRDHLIHTDTTHLITITGGKWTTYRQMAEDCVDQAARLARLPDVDCRTHSLQVHGYSRDTEHLGPLAVYGFDAGRIQELIAQEPALGEPLHPSLPTLAAEVVWAARYEMARALEDVLARRTRMLFLSAQAAIDAAPRAAQLLARELGKDEAWQTAQVSEFTELARGYLLPP